MRRHHNGRLKILIVLRELTTLRNRPPNIIDRIIRTTHTIPLEFKSSTPFIIAVIDLIPQEALNRPIRLETLLHLVVERLSIGPVAQHHLEHRVRVVDIGRLP